MECPKEVEDRNQQQPGLQNHSLNKCQLPGSQQTTKRQHAQLSPVGGFHSYTKKKIMRIGKGGRLWLFLNAHNLNYKKKTNLRTPTAPTHPSNFSSPDKQQVITIASNNRRFQLLA